jgi:hypothetical protein
VAARRGVVTVATAALVLHESEPGVSAASTHDTHAMTRGLVVTATGAVQASHAEVILTRVENDAGAWLVQQA